QTCALPILPIIAYNNPFSTRVDLTPELLALIAAEVELVVAVKEFSQDVRRIWRIREEAPRLEPICGCDDTFVESMLAGATGWIAGFVNAFPAQSVRLPGPAAQAAAHPGRRGAGARRRAGRAGSGLLSEITQGVLVGRQPHRGDAHPGDHRWRRRAARQVHGGPAPVPDERAR